MPNPLHNLSNEQLQILKKLETNFIQRERMIQSVKHNHLNIPQGQEHARVPGFDVAAGLHLADYKEISSVVSHVLDTKDIGESAIKQGNELLIGYAKLATMRHKREFVNQLTKNFDELCDIAGVKKGTGDEAAENLKKGLEMLGTQMDEVINKTQTGLKLGTGKFIGVLDPQIDWIGDENKKSRLEEIMDETFEKQNKEMLIRDLKNELAGNERGPLGEYMTDEFVVVNHEDVPTREEVGVDNLNAPQPGSSWSITDSITSFIHSCLAWGKRFLEYFNIISAPTAENPVIGEKPVEETTVRATWEEEHSTKGKENWITEEEANEFEKEQIWEATDKILRETEEIDEARRIRESKNESSEPKVESNELVELKPPAHGMKK